MNNSIEIKHDNRDIVLIVEDNSSIHEIIGTFLNDIDVQHESVFDGKSAINKCKSVDINYYSLILMDINMPDMDGFETTKALRNMGVCAPIIAITATNKNDERLSTSQHPFDFLLFKPFTSSDFFSAISTYIKNASIHASSPETIKVRVSHLAETDPEICNVQQAITNMGGSTRLFTKHFNNFKVNNVDLEQRLSCLIMDGLYHECKTLCHTMKGLIGMLGLTSLYFHITQLETLLESFAIEATTKAIPDIKSDEISKLLDYIGDDLRLVCKVQF